MLFAKLLVEEAGEEKCLLAGTNFRIKSSDKVFSEYSFFAS
jgi:hypothetical protein